MKKDVNPKKKNNEIDKDQEEHLKDQYEFGLNEEVREKLEEEEDAHKESDDIADEDDIIIEDD